MNYKNTKIKPKKKSYQFGIIAEKAAILLLLFKGYKILKWRYKSHLGEIDIIATRLNYISFIEVKARKYNFNSEDVLKSRQIARIKKSAEIFIAKNKNYQKYKPSFDYIEVNRFLLPKHYSNFIS